MVSRLQHLSMSSEMSTPMPRRRRSRTRDRSQDARRGWMVGQIYRIGDDDERTNDFISEPSSLACFEMALCPGVRNAILHLRRVKPTHSCRACKEKKHMWKTSPLASYFTAYWPFSLQVQYGHHPLVQFMCPLH